MFCFEAEACPIIFGNEIMSLYKGCKTVTSVDGEISSSFSVKVGVHHGSALNPLSFTTVMVVLTEDMRDGSLIELLYTDDLVLCGEPLLEMEKCSGRKESEGESH